VRVKSFLTLSPRFLSVLRASAVKDAQPIHIITFCAPHSFPFFLRVSVALWLIHLINAIAGARELFIHLVNAAILPVTQSSRRGRVGRGSRRAVFSV